MPKEKLYRFAELFSGPGGLSLGASRAKAVSVDGVTHKIKPIWANDIDKETCNTYARNIHNGNKDAVFCAPVEELDFTELPAFDALAFGFPCNDFSLVGEQLGFDGKFGPLYKHGVRAINANNPMWFMAENVGGLQSANDGKAFKKILFDLEKAGTQGYEITSHLYKFEEYGVPQTRHRIVIIGFRKDLNLKFAVPAPTTKGRHKTAKEAIENPRIALDAPNNEFTNQSSVVRERLTFIPPGGNAWNEEVPERLRMNVKGARLSQIYKRLHPEKPAYTVTGSGGGGTHVYHWEEPRALTNRERARLQSFPDDFVFEGNKESVRKQIGMAVPPDGAQHIVDAVLKTLAGLPYESIPANIKHNKSAGELATVASY